MEDDNLNNIYLACKLITVFGGILAFLILAYVCIFDNGNMLAIFALVAIIIITICTFIIWGIIESKYMDRLVDEGHYTIIDFGYFKTKMHEKYINSFNEYTPDIKMDNCNIKRFECKSDQFERRVKFNVQEPLDFSRYTHVNEIRTIKTVIKLTYFEFLTEEDHNSKEKEIKKIVKDKERAKHYCKDNIHIIIEAYYEAYSPYYNNHYVVQHEYKCPKMDNSGHLGYLENLRNIVFHNIELK